jgi:hypothetical protein
MKWKKDFIVNGHEYTVRFTSKLTDPSHVAECCGEDREIRIHPKQTKREKLCGLIHELLHAFEFEYGFKIAKRHRPGDAVYKLEEAIYNFLIENDLVSNASGRPAKVGSRRESKSRPR